MNYKLKDLLFEERVSTIVGKQITTTIHFSPTYSKRDAPERVLKVETDGGFIDIYVNKTQFIRMDPGAYQRLLKTGKATTDKTGLSAVTVEVA